MSDRAPKEAQPLEDKPFQNDMPYIVIFDYEGMAVSESLAYNESDAWKNADWVGSKQELEEDGFVARSVTLTEVTEEPNRD